MLLYIAKDSWVQESLAIKTDLFVLMFLVVGQWSELLLAIPWPIRNPTSHCIFPYIMWKPRSNTIPEALAWWLWNCTALSKVYWWNYGAAAINVSRDSRNVCRTCWFTCFKWCKPFCSTSSAGTPIFSYMRMWVKMYKHQRLHICWFTFRCLKTKMHNGFRGMRYSISTKVSFFSMKNKCRGNRVNQDVVNDWCGQTYCCIKAWRSAFPSVWSSFWKA